MPRKKVKKVPAPADPESDDASPIILPLLVKNWATGSQDVLLTSFSLRYGAARQLGHSKAREVADEAANVYLSTYVWPLPLNEEPLPPQLPMWDPNALEPRDDCTPYEKEYKKAWTKQMRQACHNWLEYRAMKAAPGPAGRKFMDDPLGKLVAGVAGMKSGRKRARTVEQLWSKSDEGLKTEFDSVFAKSGLPGKKRVSLWQEFVKEKYELLDDETKAQFVQMAEDEVEEIQREKDKDFKVEMLELEETQEAIEHLASTLGPLFDSLCELLNPKVGVVFAGPEPAKGGQLNAFSMFFGTNKASIPQKFNEAGKSRYKAFTRAFLSFVAEGYDREEQIARSLPPDQLETKYVEWTMDPTANRVAEEADVDDGDDNDEGGIVSTKKRKKVEEVVPSDRQTKKTRGEKKRRVETVLSSTESPAREMRVDDTDRRRDPKSESKRKSRKRGREDTRGATDVEEDDVDVPGIKRKSKKHGRDDIRGATDAEEDNVDVPSPSKHRRTRTVMRVSSPLPEFSEMEHRRGSMTSPIPEPHIDPRLYGLGGKVPLLDPADTPDPFAVSIYERPIVQRNVEELEWTAEDIALLESDPGRSSWFFDAKKYLESVGTGPEWELLLKMWTVYEGRSGFENKTSSRFKHGSRPAEVDWWINRGWEKEPPPIVNLKKFELSWWTWWRELQPEWRDKGSGTFSADSRVVKGDWEHMRKPGINRFYTILAMLAWWGRAAAIRGSESEQASWIASMVDVDWVLRGMLK